ncbi:MAG TPA: hypothetical protein VHO24_00100 [Opitutaceae bacterium]|nr:hypothetical protein [Opitutaceae bacterium]
MPSTLNLALDSAFLVLTVRGKSFTLTAPEAHLTIEPDAGGGGGPATKQHIHWKYHASYDDAVDLGTLANAADVLAEIQAMLPPPPTGPAATGYQTLMTQWDALKVKLANLPVISNAASSALNAIANTSVKITDLGLELDKDGINWKGAFTVGLAFTPAPGSIRLFSVGITAFGAVISAKLDGLKVTGGQLIWG